MICIAILKGIVSAIPTKLRFKTTLAQTRFPLATPAVFTLIAYRVPNVFSQHLSSFYLSLD